jgi:hypothetical protein
MGTQSMFVGVGILTACCSAAYAVFVPETLVLVSAKVRATATATADKVKELGAIVDKSALHPTPKSAWYELDPGTKTLLRDPQQRAVLAANAALMFNYAGACLTFFPEAGQP